MDVPAVTMKKENLVRYTTCHQSEASKAVMTTELRHLAMNRVVVITCDEAVRGDTGCSDAVVEKALHEQVAGDVDEGHEGSYVERLALHVERAQEAESAG